MKVRTLSLGMVFASLLLAAPAFAQSPKEGGSGGGGGDRSTGGGGPAGGGGNVSSGGGGGVAVSGGGGGGTSSSSGGFASPSAAGAAAADLSFGDRGFRQAAPAHRAGYSASGHTASANADDGQKATPRSAAGSNGGGGERAVPRGNAAAGSGSGSSNGGDRVARSRTAPDSNNASGEHEVPNWSRPRGDRPQTGTAVDRNGPPPSRGGGSYGRYYDPYYYNGYGYYDPYRYSLYGYGCYACTFGLGYGWYSGFGWDPYVMDPYTSGYGGYSSGIYNTRDQGNLKLKVKPRDAKVYVDGYFVGFVDQFDGAFQKLALNGGRHKVEVRAEGYETAEFDVLITPAQTITFQGELKRIQ